MRWGCQERRVTLSPVRLWQGVTGDDLNQLKEQDTITEVHKEVADFELFLDQVGVDPSREGPLLDGQTVLLSGLYHRVDGISLLVSIHEAGQKEKKKIKKKERKKKNLVKESEK